MNKLALLFSLGLLVGCNSNTSEDSDSADGSTEASPCPTAQPSEGAECSGRYAQDDFTPYEARGFEFACAYAYEDCPGAGFDYQIHCGCDDGTWSCDPYRCHWDFDDAGMIADGGTPDGNMDGGTPDAGSN